ncbi:MAG TPA: hypothetical protein VNZ53_33235 [Steroidobacteraceae bacterium]|jgi:hypothetical protein|nr:hypothetical protein [Steroidobacteraceae bacterium]
MSTRACYRFFPENGPNDWPGVVTVYKHSDGYPSGAPRRSKRRDDPDAGNVMHRALIKGERHRTRDRRANHSAMQHPRHLHVGDVVERAEDPLTATAKNAPASGSRR